MPLTFHHVCAGSCDALSADPAVFVQFAAWLSTPERLHVRDDRVPRERIGYQDALVGSALAGAKSAPLYLTPATCVPRATFAAITRLAATRVVLIGTATALTGDGAALKPCP